MLQGGVVAAEVAEKRPQRSAPGRPADVLEPWWVEPDNGLSQLVAASRDTRLDLDTVMAVTLERGFALADLAQVGVGDAADRLDKVAAGARTVIPLSNRSVSYLQRLRHGDPEATVPEPREPVLVSLPARLGDRLVAQGSLTAGVTAEGALAAVRWEIAAVLAGKTIGEWALAAELGRFSGLVEV